MAITKEFLDSCRPLEAATAPVAADAQHQTPPGASPILARLGITPAQRGAERSGGGRVQHHICVAVGTSARSNRITAQHQLTFEGFVRMLKAWPVHVGSLTLAEYQRLKGGSAKDKGRAARAKDCSWYSLARFEPATRAAANVVEITAMVLDFDGSPPLTREQVSEPLGDAGHLITSSCSHRPDEPRWRLVVPYSRPVSPAEHAQLFDHFKSLYPAGAVDTSARDAARLWFGPGCWSDTAEYREFHLQAGARFFDPDAVLTASDDTPGELPASFAARQPILVTGPHPNDALAYSPEHEKPDAEQVRRMLSYVHLTDAPGQRRAPWLKVLQGVHDCFDGSEEGFELIHEWSSTQPGYVDDADVRYTWSTCKKKGITIASVIQLALEGGFTFDPPAEEDAVEEPVSAPAQPATPDEQTPRLGRATREMRQRIREAIKGGQDPVVVARRELEADLIYIADQQTYYSIAAHTLMNQFGIKQLYRAAMPLKTTSTRMEPVQVLEESDSKPIVESMGYDPGQPDVFVEHGRQLANWYRPWIVEPAKPTAQEWDRFRYLLNHVAPKKADKVFLDYFLGLLAYSVQHPGKKVTSAPLLYSPETGTGKTTLGFEVPRLLFGPANSALVLNDETESGFSDFLARSHFLHLDEVFMGGMKSAARAADKWKPVVTNSVIRVHPKGFAGYDLTNHIIVTACSNQENALYLTDFDRRWAVHEIRSGKLDKAFAKAFYDWLWGPRGAAVLKYIFLTISTTGFNPHADAPMTREKKSMIRSRDDVVREIDAMRSEGAKPFDRQIFNLTDLRDELGRRVPRFKNTGWSRLTEAVRGFAEQLAYARRTGEEGKKQRWWTTGDAIAWSAASDDEIKAHILDGTLPARVRGATPAKSQTNGTGA